MAAGTLLAGSLGPREQALRRGKLRQGVLVRGGAARCHGCFASLGLKELQELRLRGGCRGLFRFGLRLGRRGRAAGRG